MCVTGIAAGGGFTDPGSDGDFGDTRGKEDAAERWT
jgi:hypothetical protein